MRIRGAVECGCKIDNGCIFKHNLVSRTQYVLILAISPLALRRQVKIQLNSYQTSLKYVFHDSRRQQNFVWVYVNNFNDFMCLNCSKLFALTVIYIACHPTTKYLIVDLLCCSVIANCSPKRMASTDNDEASINVAQIKIMQIRNFIFV